jgi:maltokinase
VEPHSESAEQIAALLSQWMPTQRWYAGKGRAASFAARQLSYGVEGGHDVQVWLADVSYADGGAETYQVPIVLLDEPSEALAHVYIGGIGPNERDSRYRFLYDALHDKSVTHGWIDGIRSGGSYGPLSFVPTADPSLIDVDLPSLVLTGEQSNTSLVFGDVAILKVFRRLEAGENPDVEVHRALSAAGARHIAPMLGYVQSVRDGEVTSLAMLQRFLPTATDGWELAKISVRDLMGEADLHAAEAGGDFAGEAHRLGTATAELHADLVLAFGAVAMDSDALATRASGMHRRLDLAIPIVPALAAVADGLRGAYDELAQLPADTVTAQRVHGDMHLGQTLRTSQGWVMLDFEGEPAKPISERRAPDSPVRDIAGMLRSFDYVARHQLIDSPSTQQSEYRAAEWAARNRDAFCEGYREASGGGAIDAVLLRAYEADKAVYEAVYEARNRPTWLPVPLASLARLSDEHPAGGTHRHSLSPALPPDPASPPGAAQQPDAAQPPQIAQPPGPARPLTPPEETA